MKTQDGQNVKLKMRLFHEYSGAAGLVEEIGNTFVIVRVGQSMVTWKERMCWADFGKFLADGKL